jgi:hypothetical protein
MIPQIYAAFLRVHHCPYLHTCGIYSHDPQNTWLATTSNDERSQEMNKIALPSVDVYGGVYFPFCLDVEGVTVLICHPGQVQDTPHIF